MSTHRNQFTYYTAYNCPLTTRDVARIRQDVLAAGETIHWPKLARMWDLTIERLQHLTRDLIRT